MRGMGIYALVYCLLTITSAHAEVNATVGMEVLWDQNLGNWKTIPTLQVVVNPMLRRGSRIHPQAFQALKNLGTEHVRYVPWLPYPKLGIPALYPPTTERTSWDFTLIDPMLEDFMAAMEGRKVILNFSTIPQWMVNAPQPTYHEDPNVAMWEYPKGADFLDKSYKQVAEYFGRIVKWYSNGGFTDELGKEHKSGHRYSFDAWEVLNEIDFERAQNPELYTKLYDAVVEEIRSAQPSLKFIGLGLAKPAENLRYYEYFLNPANHSAGIPVDGISYHFYAKLKLPKNSAKAAAVELFTETDKFIQTATKIEEMKKQLNPKVWSYVNELGTICDEVDWHNHALPNYYWSLSSAVYAYALGRLAILGAEVAGQSQLVGFPSQFPSVSMVNWETGEPNERYWVLKMLKDSLQLGDAISPARLFAPAPIFALGLGNKKLLVVNQSPKPITLQLTNTKVMNDVVFVGLGSSGIQKRAPASPHHVQLPGFGVAMIPVQPH